MAENRKKKPLRPSKSLTQRQLDRFLTVIAEWKKTAVEPVVGRVRIETSDPFAVLIATILSLRTRDAVTDLAFTRLWKIASTPEDLARLSVEKIEEAIRPVGFFRNKARSIKETSRIILEKHGGRVPDELETLLDLPGVGRKTANLVLTEGFNKMGICVDTHVHRILNWWGYVKTRQPDETEQVLRGKLPKKWWIPVNALLVTFGQNVCRPVAPKCGECPLATECPYPAKRV